MTTEFRVGDWLCRSSGGYGPYAARSASHNDGTSFGCDKEHGLAATTTQVSVLPPAILAWLVQPVFTELVPSDDLEDAPYRLGLKVTK